MMNEDRIGVKSAERVIDILETIASTSRGVGISDLARQLHIPKSSTWNLVRTLLHRRYLEQTPAGEFLLGARLFDVGVCGRTDTRLQTVARPMMSELVDRTGETVFLGIMTPDFEVLQIDKVVSSHVIRYDAELGQKRPAHCTAVGKLLLAELAPNQLDYYFRTKPLRRFTRRTITTRSGLIAELDRIRRTGVSVNVDERVPGASAIGVAIRVVSGRAVAGLIVAGPTSRIVARKEELVQQLTEVAAWISQALAGVTSGVGTGIGAGVGRRYRRDHSPAPTAESRGLAPSTVGHRARIRRRT